MQQVRTLRIKVLCSYKRMKEGWKCNTFFTKIYTSFYYFSKGLKFTADVSDRQTDRQTEIERDREIERKRERDWYEGHRHRLMEDCNIDPYLLKDVDFIFRDLRHCCRPVSIPLDYLNLFWLPTVTPYKCLGYRCIYNFLTPMRSSGSLFTWSAYTSVACLPVITLFTQLEHLVQEIPDWRLCQRSVCNKKLVWE